MHQYLILRGVGKFLRRVVEDLNDVYCNFKGKDGKEVKLMLGVREIKTYEVIFPVTAKKVIKDKIKEVVARHKHVQVHFGPKKKDKFFRGVEFL